MNCLYFVAKGTLDDVLWKLLEKKFRDLGKLPFVVVAISMNIFQCVNSNVFQENLSKEKKS